MDSKKYKKPVNITDKEAGPTAMENKLVVTSGEREGRGNIGMGEWDMQTTE